MPRRSARRLLVGIVLTWCLCFVGATPTSQPSEAQHKAPPPLRRKYSYTEASGDLFCRPFGECEPCPADELDQPFCQPFGNRRLVHCIPRSQADDPYASEVEVDHPIRARDGAGKKPPTLVGVSGSSKSKSLDGDIVGEGVGEVPAWEACGKVVASERAAYWEFVVINTLLLTLSLVVLLVRTNSLAANQYRQLAARIGISARV